MTEPMLGVVFRPQSPPERLREIVLAAESAGVAELWLWEDCFGEGGLSATAAALAWSERLAVAVGLLPVPLRNPALAAMEIATLARMFPGRLSPGLGHGVLEWMEQVGAGVASPMTLLREHTTAVRDLLHGRTVDAAGRFVRLRDVTLEWPPDPAPPLLIGARGPRTVALAAELADGVILDTNTSAADVRGWAGPIAAARAAAGRTDPFRVVVYAGIDPAAPGLAQRVADTAGELGEAGADTVAFVSTGADPDPEPLIAVCGRG